MPRGKERHRQHAEPERRRIGEVSEIEIADLADEQVADDEVEEAPQHIDGRRRQPLPRRSWRTGSGTAAHHAGDAMGDGVGEEGAAEEIGDEMQPRHVSRPP